MSENAITKNSTKVFLATIVWFLIALAIGASGVLANIKPPLPQIILFSLAGLVLLLFKFHTTFGEWATSVDLRVFIAFHITRFVGFYFLYLYARGELPWAFAVPGGWGDNVVAFTAIIIILFAPKHGKTAWWVFLVWNVFGLVDILGVVLSAIRLGLTDPDSLSPLLRLPLSLLPTFIVPIVISTHIIIFWRLFKRKKEDFCI